ncbi:MCM DNA helicase complex subunit mcm6, variant 2 [Homalodisca vitripennis]|nr:MCM DNA helicase complex subunit mcm6, variant 2 [Homalodisca vitripennis]
MLFVSEMADASEPVATDASQQKKKLKLSFDEYKSIANMLVTYVRNEEDKSDSEGIRRSDVVNWYLEKISDQIDTEEELVEKKALIEKIIDRLIFHDQVIIPLTSSKAKSDETEEEDPLLVVHPNYVVDI